MSNNDKPSPLKQGNPHHELTREDSSKGGKASQRTRRRRKAMREWAKALGKADMDFKLPDGEVVHGDMLGGIVLAQMRKAAQGNTVAAKFIADLLGEMEQTVNVKSNGLPVLQISKDEAEALGKWAAEKK